MYWNHTLTRSRAVLLAFVISAGLPAAQAQMVAVEEDTGNLYAVSMTDATLSLIGGTGLSNLGALEFNLHDGNLYAMTTGESASLYRFHISPGWDDVSVELCGELGIQHIWEGGLAFAPDGTAYGLNGGATIPLLFTIDNLDTGAATIVAELDGRHDIAGLGWRGDRDGVLVGLDSTTNTLLTIYVNPDDPNDPATGTTGHIEGVGPAIGSIGGMVLLEDQGYFATAGPLAETPGSNELYSFNPFTGDQAGIGDFDAAITGHGFSGLAIVPEPTTLGLLVAGAFALLRRRRA